MSKEGFVEGIYSNLHVEGKRWRERESLKLGAETSGWAFTPPHQSVTGYRLPQEVGWPLGNAALFRGGSPQRGLTAESCGLRH